MASKTKKTGASKDVEEEDDDSNSETNFNKTNNSDSIGVIMAMLKELKKDSEALKRQNQDIQQKMQSMEQFNKNQNESPKEKYQEVVDLNAPLKDEHWREKEEEDMEEVVEAERLNSTKDMGQLRILEYLLNAPTAKELPLLMDLSMENIKTFLKKYEEYLVMVSPAMRKKLQAMVKPNCITEIVHKTGFTLNQVQSATSVEFKQLLCCIHNPKSSLEAVTRLKQIPEMKSDLEYSSILEFIEEWDFQLLCQARSTFIPKMKLQKKTMLEGIRPDMLRLSVEAAGPETLEEVKKLLFSEAETLRSWSAYTKIAEFAAKKKKEEYMKKNSPQEEEEEEVQEEGAGKGAAHADKTCTFCKRTGHTEQECFKKDPSRLKCKLCLKTGHGHWTCPTNLDKQGAKVSNVKMPTLLKQKADGLFRRHAQLGSGTVLTLFDSGANVNAMSVAKYQQLRSAGQVPEMKPAPSQCRVAKEREVMSCKGKIILTLELLLDEYKCTLKEVEVVVMDGLDEELLLGIATLSRYKLLSYMEEAVNLNINPSVQTVKLAALVNNYEDELFAPLVEAKIGDDAEPFLINKIQDENTMSSYHKEISTVITLQGLFQFNLDNAAHQWSVILHFNFAIPTMAVVFKDAKIVDEFVINRILNYRGPKKKNFESSYDFRNVVPCRPKFLLGRECNVVLHYIVD